MKRICCAAVLLLVSLFGTVHAAQAASSAVPRRIAVVRMQTLYQESRAGTGAMA